MEMTQSMLAAAHRTRVAGTSTIRANIIVAVALVIVMLLGGYARFMANNWDDFVRFHPDERYLSSVAESLGRNPILTSFRTIDMQERCLQRYPATNGVGGYFDTDCSPYNPENVVPTQYSYGTLPLFMVRATGEFVVELTGDSVWISYSGVHLIWRAISAAADSIIILLVFVIGFRMHDKWVGLAAAVLYAAAVLPIQLAHFGTADAIASMFVTLALYFAVRAQDTGSLWDYGAFGLALGAAVASRVNIAPLAAIIAVVAFVRILPAFDSYLSGKERNRIVTLNIAGVALAAFMSLLIFRLLNPYAFSGPGFFGILPDHRYLSTLSQSQSFASGVIDWPPNWQWANRTPYLYAFQNMVLWGMGMALGVTGWLAWVVSGWRLLRGKVGATRNLVPFVWIGGYFAFMGGIWVMAMRYYLPLYPVLTVLAAWALVELVRRAYQPGRTLWRRAGATALAAGVIGFTVLWALMFTNIYRNMATFTQAGHWVWENIPGDFSMRLDDAGDDVPLINIPLWNTIVREDVPIETRLAAQASRLSPGRPMSYEFVAPGDGTISSVIGHRIGDPGDSSEIKTLVINIYDADTPGQALASTTLEHTFPRDAHLLGERYELVFDTPLEISFGERYVFEVTVYGSGLMTSGGVILTEPWEEGTPSKVCTLPPGTTLADNPPPGSLGHDDCNARTASDGLVNTAELDISGEDHAGKRRSMEILLDQGDYIMISTNRRYDSQARNLHRWPMTNRYYEALFSGELGFDLVGLFHEMFALGPLRVSDQHLPIYDSPAWLNEFEAEEAFHVYDHPAVFIFQKNEARYSPANTRAILRSVPLTRVESGFWGNENPTVYNVIPLSSMEIDDRPTQLMFTDEMRQIQIEGGTWSDRFTHDSLINRNQILAVIIWWFIVLLFGWAAWPLLFITMPALSDRGYGFAKFVGMLLVAWGTWTLATLRVPVWSQGGILGGLLVLAAVSAIVAWQQRILLVSFLRARWRLLLVMELIAFGLFLVFIGVRLTNPDLWHNAYGGEKPLNFAYFNGVLRSTIFPAVDPWFAGGYLNYYYFGYVIMAAPTLLSGILPSIAFNLIIPTLFALTGIAAFSAAFGITHGWRTRIPVLPEESSDEPATKPRRRPLGNPWIAGIMALLLAVVLGNLDTPRIAGMGIARLGGYEQPTGMADYFLDQEVDSYLREQGTLPDDEMMLRLVADARARADSGNLINHVRYELDSVLDFAGSFINGLRQMTAGRELYISPDRWFWGPTRIITEIPNQNDGAINEMPIFTFVYADLHPHMIAMPMMLFVLVFVFNELMTAGRDRRGLRVRYLALFFGALTVGLFQATNTWDYPTFLILGVVGLGYAWWLAWERITRWSLLSMFTRIGGFLIMAWLVVMPFTWWFASGLTEFKLWEGKKTPLWAYLDIHGLFIFLVVSLLIWETARWLRSVRVAELRGRYRHLLALAGGIAVVLLVSVVMAIMSYHVALIVVPLVAWIALLFFRPGQSRPMQYVLVLAGLALSITMGTEIVTLAYDNGRQNTIFKFYIQVWLILSVVGGVGFAWVISQSGRWSSALAGGWYAFAALLILVAALFPIMAVRGKAVFRMAPDVPLTLDGLEYMQYTRHFEDGVIGMFDMADDYRIIRWLQDNVDGSPVIMEAQSKGSLYKYGGRISITTGLPSVVGWDYHQRQQRSLDPLPSLVNARAANVNAFYTTTSVDEAMKILDFYNVRYIILSSYERQRYTPTEVEIAAGARDGLAKFPIMLEEGLLSVAFQDGDAVVYEVNHDALWSLQLAQAREAYAGEGQQTMEMGG